MTRGFGMSLRSDFCGTCNTRSLFFSHSRYREVPVTKAKLKISRQYITLLDCGLMETLYLDNIDPNPPTALKRDRERDLQVIVKII